MEGFFHMSLHLLESAKGLDAHSGIDWRSKIVLIVLLISFAIVIFVVCLLRNRAKDEKKEAESRKEFQNTYLKIEQWTGISSFFGRIKTIRMIGLLMLAAGLASCAMFVFAPIFQIKLELFGETLAAKEFSLWDEVLRFYESSHSHVLSGIQLVFAVISYFILGFAVLFLIVALITVFIHLWQCFAIDKKRIINTFTHSVCDEKEKTQNNFAFNISPNAVDLLIGSDVCFIVYILLMKYLFKDVVLENALSSSITNFPLVNSVSWIWCILTVVLFLVCIGIGIYVKKCSKGLTKEINSFLSSLPKDNQNSIENA